jgi:hypothetical protein
MTYFTNTKYKYAINILNTTNKTKVFIGNRISSFTNKLKQETFLIKKNNKLLEEIIFYNDDGSIKRTIISTYKSFH